MAQEGAVERTRLPGFVVDSAGKRVPGADVHLTSWPLPFRTDVGTSDRVRITTDAQGLFRAELLAGRGYSAWATWHDFEGVGHRTDVAEHVRSGPPRELTEAPLQTLQRLRIEGATAWQARGPLRVTVVFGGDNAIEQVLQPDLDLVAPVPTLPGKYATFLVRAADGQLLGLASSAPIAGSAAEVVATLAPPVPVRIVVVDERGQPVAGAQVWQANKFSFGAGHRHILPDRIGTTAADGTSTVELPEQAAIWSQQPRSEHVLTLEAHGRARKYARLDLAKSRELRVGLPPAPELRGRLLGEGGEPAKGVLLLPEAYAQAEDMPSAGFGVAPQPLRVGEDGRFSFSGLHPQYGFRLLAVLDASQARELGMKVAPGWPLAPVSWLAVGTPPFGSPHDLGDLRLDQLPVARIEVRTHDDQPAPGALLHVTTRDLYNSPLDHVVDRVGRLQLPLPGGDVQIGAYVEGGGVARVTARVPPGPGDPPLDPLVLTLTRPVTVTGVVVDQDGRPVRGAIVRPWNRPEHPGLADLAFHAHAASTPTGADGDFAVRVPFGGVRQALRAWVPDGGRQVAEILHVAIEEHGVEGVRFVLDLTAGKDRE